MSVDGFNAGLLIDLPSAVFVNESVPAQDGATLDAALAQPAPSNQHGARDNDGILDHAPALSEARLVDLWGIQSARAHMPTRTTEAVFEPLQIGELKATHSDRASLDYEGQTVVVTGHRYVYNGAIGLFQGDNDDHWAYSSEQPTPPPPHPDEQPPDLNCSDTSQMSPEQLLDYKISEEAAKIAREILARPDHDYIEYASFIYMDSDGSIHHTEIRAGTPTSSSPSDAGIHYGQIYGMVHSHPGAQFIADDPLFKLFPTPDNAGNNGQGDWYAYDYVANGIYLSAINDDHVSQQDAMAHLAGFRQYILGAAGPLGSNNYQLHGYDMNNRDMETLGQKISLNLGLCH